ncbi:MAG: IS110 family transposase [Verrucomicrobia bacterium]|nr:IS110 family transposase [Verrucomicrobiota bacterium]
MRPAAKLPVINPHAAGIDIGSVEHWVCVPEDAVLERESNVRAFGAFTRDLDQLVEWLQECGVKTVAMESTGVFWIALAQKLEAAGIEVVLVNAKHLKYVPGRKTDLKDCQWLQQLHSYGLLNGSFRPTQDICALRSLMRHRENLGHSAGRAVQHMQQALQQMNVHLHHAVSDLDGQTGLRIVDAILAGQRDPKKLVELRDEKCHKTTPEELEAALVGDWRAEHLFVLKQARETYQHLADQIQGCDREIERTLALVVIPEVTPPQEPAPKNPPGAEKPRKKKAFKPGKAGTGLQKDLGPELQRICGVDLTQIIGLNVLGVLIILSEIGLDMSRWRSVKAFCSWLGLCPGNKISGGKVLSSRTPPVVNRVAILLRAVAPAVGRSDTWLGSFHRRMRARLGPAGANTATARKLAVLIYHLLKYKEDYIDVDRLIYEEKLHRIRLSRVTKQAAELGYELVKRPMAG